MNSTTSSPVTVLMSMQTPHLYAGDFSTFASVMRRADSTRCVRTWIACNWSHRQKSFRPSFSSKQLVAVDDAVPRVMPHSCRNAITVGPTASEQGG